MSWLIAEIDGARRVLDTRARTLRTVRAAVTRQRKRGLRVLAAYLHTAGPLALAKSVPLTVESKPLTVESNR
jgi:hypothetical protein